MSNKPKAEKRMRNTKGDTDIHICPVCGSKRVNLVEFNKYYCIDCCIEIDNKGKAFTILYDGSLVNYHVNEFMNCG